MICSRTVFENATAIDGSGATACTYAPRRANSLNEGGSRSLLGAIVAGVFVRRGAIVHQCFTKPLDGTRLCHEALRTGLTSGFHSLDPGVVRTKGGEFLDHIKSVFQTTENVKYSSSFVPRLGAVQRGLVPFRLRLIDPEDRVGGKDDLLLPILFGHHQAPRPGFHAELQVLCPTSWTRLT